MSVSFLDDEQRLGRERGRRSPGGCLRSLCASNVLGGEILESTRCDPPPSEPELAGPAVPDDLASKPEFGTEEG
eukprot:7224840-Lingulodinium_polyedra.AAC.1